MKLIITTALILFAKTLLAILFLFVIVHYVYRHSH